MAIARHSAPPTPAPPPPVPALPTPPPAPSPDDVPAVTDLLADDRDLDPFRDLAWLALIRAWDVAEDDPAAAVAHMVDVLRLHGDIAAVAVHACRLHERMLGALEADPVGHLYGERVYSGAAPLVDRAGWLESIPRDPFGGSIKIDARRAWSAGESSDPNHWYGPLSVAVNAPAALTGSAAPD